MLGKFFPCRRMVQEWEIEIHHKGRTRIATKVNNPETLLWLQDPVPLVKNKLSIEGQFSIAHIAPFRLPGKDTIQGKRSRSTRHQQGGDRQC